MRLLSLFLLTAAVPAMPAWAAADPGDSAQSTAALSDATQSGDQIVVTAGRTVQPLSEVGQSITIIDAKTIRTQQAVTPLELLRQVPGVSIAQNGGIGTTASVFIRGADSDQTVALIDGVKINDPSTPAGGFDFGSLLIGNIDRIEVLRGPSSVLWGSQAMGGVVNLITRQPTDHLAVNASAEGGSFGTAHGIANVSDKIGPLSASIGGGYFRTDGISAFDGGTERDGDKNYGANASFNLALTDAISIDLRGYYSHSRTDIDGFPPPNFVLADDAEYQVSRELIGYAGLNAALFDGHFRNRIGFSYTDTKTQDFDPTSDVELTFLGKGRNARIDYQGSVDIAPGIQATFGAEHEHSRFLAISSFDFPASPPPNHADIDSGYAQIVATPIKGLTLTGGARYDHHSRFGGKTSFAGSGVYSPNGGATTFRASYTEGFKVPSLYQLFSNYGNLALRPERSKGWDAGVTQKALDGRFEASATYFRRTSRNLIDFVSCFVAVPAPQCTDNAAGGFYDNIDRARSQGVEVTVALKPVDAFRVSASYTYLDARNLSAGAEGLRLARRPDNSITLNADYDWAFGLSTGATVTHVSGSWNDVGNTQRLQGYVLTGLRASYPIGRNLEVYGRIDNLFDVHYETATGYGQPGRAAYGGVRFSY
ncbi:TonB-dependent receptor [Sphingomonas sp. CGMCC 1.13654]|uniref:TonB-dependent receptor n=1 Tax=Sphingomonas chungangi TaxID=2683589 RepID=A0A838L095_9SPHN|nr:TonB-dependent receptor [Sphingomonas chungangi]MBA2932634.1 TonB-dependent receptor [Sphingomonas chungangi]MVW56257.1 TonB-dependent receptor [Sphingomonas chungangi]